MAIEWFGNMKDIIVSTSALAVAFFAYRGLNRWQEELKGKSEYQLAKNVLQSVYKVREAFKSVRNVAIYSYEYPTELVLESGHVAQKDKAQATMHVYHERFKNLDSAFVELEDLFIQALVEWGSEKQDLIVDMRKQRSELLVAIQTLIDGYREPGSNSWMTQDERKRQNCVLYYTGENSKYSEFSDEVNLAVNGFDKWLRPHINRSK